MTLPVVLAALAAVIIWGASPVATKIAVMGLPVIDVSVLRTFLGGLAALPLALLMRVPLPAGWPERRLLAASAVVGFVIYPVALTYGVQATSANHASLILASLPVFTGAIAQAWDRRLPKGVWWLGCTVALAGEAVLILGRSDLAHHGATLEGDLVILVSNALASFGYVTGARLQAAGYASIGTTFWGVTIAALVLVPFLPFVLTTDVWPAAPIESWIAVGYQAIMVTIVGYMLWYWALGRGGIARMGLFQFLQPISGVLLASILLAEPLTWTLGVAATLILGGVFIAVRAR